MRYSMYVPVSKPPVVLEAPDLSDYHTHESPYEYSNGETKLVVSGYLLYRLTVT